MERKRAIITGASGQDALLLSEYLIGEHDYEVWAMARRVARPQSQHVNALIEKYPEQYHLIGGDITDIVSIKDALRQARPHEFYNLAAQSHVGISFKEPLATYAITQMGAINCMEAVRDFDRTIRFYQASSSEMFGGTKATDSQEFTVGSDELKTMDLAVINEDTPLIPMSPYGVAKAAAHNHARILRESYGMHISCGILFNHESELRKLNFVTRKVTAYVAKLCFDTDNGAREVERLKLGCLDFARDWGCAKDYVRGMHLMLQHWEGDDYVLATNRVHTGEDLLKAAFGKIDWQEYVEFDPEFARPNDVKVLIGNASKAEEVLGWKPERSFEKLIDDMVSNDIKTLQTEGVILE